MSSIAQVENGMAANAMQTNEAADTTKKTKVSGKTIGEPQLSETAAKYYESLKQKYSNMDFILVSKDKKEQAQAQAGNYANASKMVVLIDEEKIERMASDENYRKQYEGIIQNAAGSLSQMKAGLANTQANVKTYGIKVNDNGTASLFAVLDKSTAAQKKRIEKHAEAKKTEKKEAARKAEKKKQEERLEQSRTDTGKSDKTERANQSSEAEDTVTVTASSLEELLNKINDIVYADMSNHVQTPEEKQVGQHIDYRM